MIVMCNATHLPPTRAATNPSHSSSSSSSSRRNVIGVEVEGVAEVEASSKTQLVSDDQFNAYVKHQKSLKRKLQSKQKCKSKCQTSDSDMPPAFASVASSSPPSVHSETGDGDDVFPPTINQNVGVTFDQIKDLLGLFSKSFDAKLNVINSRFDEISQDFNHSLSAPTVVAERNEPTPNRTPLSAYSDVLGANLGGPAATEASSDIGFPSQMLFGEFLARIRDLECKFGYLPDNYLMTLQGKVIHSPDYSLYLSDDAIFDSVRSFCLRLRIPFHRCWIPLGTPIQLFLFCVHC